MNEKEIKMTQTKI